MAGIRRHSPPAVHAAANGRSRNDHDALSVRAGALPDVVHTQLAVSILCGGLCRSDPLARRHDPNGSLLGLFLDLLYQVRLFLFFFFSFPNIIPLSTIPHKHLSECFINNPFFLQGATRQEIQPSRVKVYAGGKGERELGKHSNHGAGLVFQHLYLGLNPYCIYTLSCFPPPFGRESEGAKKTPPDVIFREKKIPFLFVSSLPPVPSNFEPKYGRQKVLENPQPPNFHFRQVPPPLLKEGKKWVWSSAKRFRNNEKVDKEIDVFSFRQRKLTINYDTSTEWNQSIGEDR